MIRIENVSKSYGELSLFSGISFSLSHRERLGVVGRNGHGKTTLFRMILGSETPDAGTIIIPKNYRIGYVRQKLEFGHQTILDEAISALSVIDEAQHWKAEKILAEKQIIIDHISQDLHEAVIWIIGRHSKTNTTNSQ